MYDMEELECNKNKLKARRRYKIKQINSNRKYMYDRIIVASLFSAISILVIILNNKFKTGFSALIHYCFFSAIAALESYNAFRVKYNILELNKELDDICFEIKENNKNISSEEQKVFEKKYIRTF